MSKVIEYLDNLLVEKQMWSGEVKTHWTPPEGFFNRSAEKIASGLKRASENLKQAMARLNFYRNRSGKNLSAEDKARLKNAAEKLHALYECVNESKTVTAKSGLKGWQDKLRKVYGSLEEFKRYCENYGVHKRLGFDSPEDAWEANPTIRGSVKPEDLEVVKEAEEKTPYIIMGQLGSRTPEKLDSADDEHSADYLVNEYKMAFGPKWKIWKEIDK